MSFLDQLGGKVADMAGKAVGKAGDATNVIKLNSMISDEEKKINNSYCQIGRIYVSLHQNDYEGEFDGLIASIRESTQKVEEWRRQIQDIKGVQRCPNCGGEVASGAAFCSQCGAPMPKAQPVPAYNAEEYIKCVKCGAMLKKGTKFCMSCGTPVGMTQPTPGPAAEADTGEAAEPAEKVCPSCGSKLEADATFCTECGAQL